MKRNQPIKVLIADDHELLRDGLSLILEKELSIDVLGLAANGRELLQLARTLRPEVILTDIVMPVMDGIEATKSIKNDLPDTEVIALSMFDDQSMIVDMVEAGAIGYLLKNADKTEIINAIHAAGEHEHYYSKTISIKLAKYVSQMKVKQEQAAEFTDKELQIIRFICMEFTNGEIGKEMFFSKRTIEGYRSKILHKMNVKGVAGIVIYAIQHGLFQPESTKAVNK